ncbi:MAG: HD domain-containing protein [Planctomycetes bacterium]|nr:HD domain-containing protein [Planctomycetota bacterium]
MTLSGDVTLREVLRRDAPWLFEAELEVCVVGSAALAEACRRAGVDCPTVRDVDLAWQLDVAAGESLLARHGVGLSVTVGNRARGTLAFRAAARRIEVTSFRGDGDSRAARIRADLERRDMTIGAIAWSLADDVLHDPFHGLDHWRSRRIEAVGEPRARVDEHPVRFLRYYRRAHSLGFTLAAPLRKLAFEPAWASSTPGEAIAAELRRVLEDVPSPGTCLVELHEAGALVRFAPELAPQFDGRPAGPIRHHPEISQALHLVLALDWAKARTTGLPEADRLAVLIAVLCHDLGKGLTPDARLPAHHGHEADGVPLVHSLLDRLPGLADARGRKLAEAVCLLHLEARRLRQLRAGTVASLYDRWFRAPDFPVELFALAVGADVGGRLGRAAEGERVREALVDELRAIRAACAAVDAAGLRARFATDLSAFRRELHDAWCAAIRGAFAEDPRGPSEP